MALQTDFRLGLFEAVRRRWRRIETCVGGDFGRLPLVPTVAIDACDSPGFVRAALPEHPVASFVARQAGIVLFLRCISGIFGESDRNRLLTAPCFDMGSRRTVTRLASKSFLVILW